MRAHVGGEIVSRQRECRDKYKAAIWTRVPHRKDIFTMEAPSVVS